MIAGIMTTTGGQSTLKSCMNPTGSSLTKTEAFVFLYIPMTTLMITKNAGGGLIFQGNS